MEYTRHLQNISAYYLGTVTDYRFWSQNYSFHFGYYRKGINPFSRTSLLEQLEKEIFQMLKIDKVTPGTVLDLGCGLGGSMRTGSKLFKDTKFYGINFMPEHVALGNKITQHRGLAKNVNLVEGDYLNIPFENESAHAAYMLESFCYCPEDKVVLLASELSRVLRSGGRVVIADGFQNRPVNSQNPFLQKAYYSFCRSWALAGLHPHADVIAAFEKSGFVLVENDDISFKVLPSFMHIPFALLLYTIKLLFKNKFKTFRDKETRRHLKGCIISLLIGLNRRQFRYGLITFEKKKEHSAP